MAMKGYCEGCKYSARFYRRDDPTPFGGACNNPKHPLFPRTTFTGYPKRKPKWCPGRELKKIKRVVTTKITEEFKDGNLKSRKTERKEYVPKKGKGGRIQ